MNKEKASKMVRIALASIIFLSLSASYSMAEKQLKTFKQKVGKSITKIKLNGLDGKLEIIGSDNRELIIQTTHSFEVPKKAAGLKSMSYTDEDNTSLGLFTNIKESILVIKPASQYASRAEYKIIVPKGLVLEILETKTFSESLIVSNTQNELIIKRKGDKLIKNNNGAITIDSTGGGVEIIFERQAPKYPISVKTKFSDIDISLPSKSKFDLEAKTYWKDIYTNFEYEQMNLPNKEEHGQKHIKAKVNGGGVKLLLLDSGGDIYIRKSDVK
ncbi:hypothetical protein [Aureibacter tunicatorum]|uniref:Adhesin domain-containing protein n=1 Tax=Aureibacter tunicatorum TaxID=866807 RepID=A0AAE3XRQ4_9BACT|nr:hypothetical protein [Aureibacter tunicatorum]MDR6241415.1 hypothetical protein [Aureibacter tunicatorum]BDD06740.1 hypothetical protein AUTU_42230 [Aureibacter tunicatorum]